MKRTLTVAIGILFGSIAMLVWQDVENMKAIEALEDRLKKAELHNEYQWETLTHVLEKEWKEISPGQGVEIEFIIDDTFKGAPTWKYKVMPFPEGSVIPMEDIKETDAAIQRPKR